MSLLWIATNCRIGLSLWSSLMIFPPSVLFQRVTMGSAAWFGPYRPNIPRPDNPVRPRMFNGSLLWTYNNFHIYWLTKLRPYIKNSYAAVRSVIFDAYPILSFVTFPINISINLIPLRMKIFVIYIRIRPWSSFQMRCSKSNCIVRVKKCIPMNQLWRNFSSNDSKIEYWLLKFQFRNIQ